MEDTKQSGSQQRGDKYIVRFPSGMRDRIAEAASQNKRSMNSEIIERISLTFKWDDVAHPEPSDLLSEIKLTMAHLDSLIKEYEMQKVVGRMPEEPLEP